jgi:hypothetical protein
LDDRRFHEWITLFTDDVRYWMSGRSNRYPKSSKAIAILDPDRYVVAWRFLRPPASHSNSSGRIRSTCTSRSPSTTTSSKRCWEKRRRKEKRCAARSIMGFVRSVYFGDPNGYVVELTASTGVHQEMMDPALSKPHDALARWQTAKPS